MEIFGGLNIVFLSGFFGVFMLKKSGLIFKSPVATVSQTPDLGSFIMSMASSAIVLCTHRGSILIHVHPHSRNTSKHHS